MLVIAVGLRKSRNKNSYRHIVLVNSISEFLTMILRRLIVATSNHVVLLIRAMVMIVVGIMVVVMVMVLLTGIYTTSIMNTATIILRL